MFFDEFLCIPSDSRNPSLVFDQSSFRFPPIPLRPETKLEDMDDNNITNVVLV